MTDFTTFKDHEIIDFIAKNYSLFGNGSGLNQEDVDGICRQIQKKRILIEKQPHAFAVIDLATFVEPMCLMFLYVEKPYGGQGIGQSLINKIKNQYKEQKITL